MIRSFFSALVALLVLSSPARAELVVLTTLSDLDAVVHEVGGPDVSTSAFCKGTQDPHYLEPKPSYMVNASHADLVVSIGLGLEIGWLPGILQGARNPKIQPGQPGFIEVGPMLHPLEVATGKVSRAEGDVHPEGNPHVTLDPERVGDIAIAIGDRLAQLDPAHSAGFKSRAASMKARLAQKTKAWQQRIAKTGVKKVITFHKTLTYFFDRFQLENPAILEPLPGVPPTAKHTIEIIDKAKAEHIGLILVENFFDPTVAERVAKDVPGLRVAVVAVSVGGEDDVKSIDDVYEKIVQAIEGSGKNG